MKVYISLPQQVKRQDTMSILTFVVKATYPSETEFRLSFSSDTFVSGSFVNMFM